MRVVRECLVKLSNAFLLLARLFGKHLKLGHVTRLVQLRVEVVHFSCKPTKHNQRTTYNLVLESVMTQKEVNINNNYFVCGVLMCLSITVEERDTSATDTFAIARETTVTQGEHDCGDDECVWDLH